MSPAYDSVDDIFIVKNYHGGNRFFSDETPDPSGGRIEQPESVVKESVVTAVYGRTGEVLWEIKESGESNSGVLATAGRLVFTGDSQGWLSALDINAGKELWRYRLGGQIAMAPITYLYHGVQEIAVTSGGSLFAFSLP